MLPFQASFKIQHLSLLRLALHVEILDRGLRRFLHWKTLSRALGNRHVVHLIQLLLAQITADQLAILGRYYYRSPGRYTLSSHLLWALVQVERFDGRAAARRYFLCCSLFCFVLLTWLLHWILSRLAIDKRSCYFSPSWILGCCTLPHLDHPREAARLQHRRLFVQSFVERRIICVLRR